MKAASELAKKRFRHIRPCVHGADVLEAAGKSGFREQDLLDFSSSINPLGMPKGSLEALKNGLWQIPSYPDSNSTTLRLAIANHHGLASVENVVVGNGSTELIYLFADVFMQTGEVALTAAPSFGEYASAVQKTGAKIKHIRLSKDFSVSADKFIKAITRKTKIVYLCNPNNPTSKLIPKITLNAIIEKALEKDSLVFLDEDFLEFVEDDQERSMISQIDRFPNLFVLRSFTKLYGLTGLRVGYGVCSKEVARILMNAKLPWNVNCLGQVAAAAALDDPKHVKQTWALIKKEKQFLLNGLTQHKSLKVYPPDANFIFIDIRKSGFTAAQLKEKLLQQGILIRDCTSFAGLDEFYVRVAVKTRRENERLLLAFKGIVR